MSRGSLRFVSGAPLAKTMVQVPVETTAKGSSAPRRARCLRNEAFESWMPHSTRVSGDSPVQRARSGRMVPSTSQAARIFGKRCAQPRRSPRPDQVRASGRQRSVCAPSEVTSDAATPESHQAQYCG
jgi:hypothetical protein